MTRDQDVAPARRDRRARTVYIHAVVVAAPGAASAGDRHRPIARRGHDCPILNDHSDRAVGRATTGEKRRTAAAACDIRIHRDALTRGQADRPGERHRPCDGDRPGLVGRLVHREVGDAVGVVRARDRDGIRPRDGSGVDDHLRVVPKRGFLEGHSAARPRDVERSVGPATQVVETVRNTDDVVRVREGHGRRAEASHVQGLEVHERDGTGRRRDRSIPGVCTVRGVGRRLGAGPLDHQPIVRPRPAIVGDGVDKVSARGVDREGVVTDDCVDLQAAGDRSDGHIHRGGVRLRRPGSGSQSVGVDKAVVRSVDNHGDRFASGHPRDHHVPVEKAHAPTRQDFTAFEFFQDELSTDPWIWEPVSSPIPDNAGVHDRLSSTGARLPVECDRWPGNADGTHFHSGQKGTAQVHRIYHPTASPGGYLASI